ncbi:MAG: hypothetical protein ACP6IS_01345 [Candidatus Asgardarchaeia archaeon]
MITRLIISDIFRKKLETITFIVSTSVALFASLISTQLVYTPYFLFGSNTLFLPLSYRRMFNQMAYFLWFVSLFSLVFSSYSLSYFMIKNRQRDIFAMKTNGATTEVIYSFFIYRFILLTLISISFSLMAIYFYSLLVHPFILNILSIITLLSFIFSVYYSSYSITSSLVQIKNPFAYFMNVFSDFSYSLSSFVRKLSWKSRYALRILKRSGNVAKFLSIAMFINFFLLAFLVSSYFTFSDTTTYYIERSVGRNVVAIGSPNMLFFYRSFNSFKTATIPINLTNELMPELLFNRTSSLPFVARIERRLILKTIVKTIAYVPESSSSSGNVDVIFEETYAIGVEFNSVTSNWMIYGNLPNSSWQVLIGDSLDTFFLEKGSYESIYLYNRKFSVSGICITTENKGNVVYISLKELSKLTSIHGFNLILIQLTDSSPNVINELATFIHSAGYDFLFLDDIAEENISTIRSIWTFIMITTASIVISTVSAIGTFVFVQLSLNSNELLIMHLIGASKKDYTEIAFNMGFISIIQIALPAYVLGAVIGYIHLFRIAILLPSSILFLAFIEIALLLFMITIFRSVSLQFYKNHKALTALQ